MMFIGEEAGREFVSRSVPLNAGFKGARAQLADAWASTRFEDLSTSKASALMDEANDFISRFEKETGEKFNAPNPYFHLGRMSNPVDLVGDATMQVLTGENWAWSPNGTYDREHKQFWARVDQIATQYPEFQTNEDAFMQNIIRKADNLRTRRDSGNLRAWGSIADFVGSTGALMSDPVNIASMVFGGGGAVAGARSLLSRLMSTAGREAVIGAVAETAIQPDVMEFKRDLGVEYGVGDAVSNIAQGALGGALFGAAGEVIGAGARAYAGPSIQQVRAQWQAATDAFPELADAPGARHAQAVLDDVSAAYNQSPFEETLVGNAAHERAFATAAAQILQGQPVELRDVFDGLKRMPETKPVKVTVDETGKAAAGDAPIDGGDVDAGQVADIDIDRVTLAETRAAVDVMFDPGKQPAKPRDVLSIINEMGGIKPEGETRAMDLHTMRPGLVRKGGKSFGEIREHLEEIGMLPEGSADNEVFDLIDDAVRGNADGVYHPEDFDRALDWEAWREAQGNADISREFAHDLLDAAEAQGRFLSMDDLRDVMARTDPRSGDDAAAVVGQWIKDRPQSDVPRQAGFGVDGPAIQSRGIDWARALDLADSAEEAAERARRFAIRDAMGDIAPDDLAKIEQEAISRFEDMKKSRPAMEYSRAELKAEVDKIMAKPENDLTIVDPENFDAEGDPVEVSAREFLDRSKEEIEDAQLIAQCILNKVA